MVKRKQVNKKPKRPKQRTVAAGLDDAARRWLRLLADPCGAELTHPLYSGAGSAYLGRYRWVVSPVATASDFVFNFNPTQEWGVAGYSGWAEDAGNNLGTRASHGMPAFLTGSYVDGYRCVAACVRVVYTGAVMDCKGRVGFAFSNSGNYNNFPVTGNVNPNSATKWLMMCQQTSHLSTAVSEARWLPSGDAAWMQPGDNSDRVLWNGSSLTVVVSNAPPGSFYLEVVMAAEWSPGTTTSNGMPTGIVDSPAAGKSSNTVNQVLNTIDRVYGGLVAFATNPGVAGAVRAATQVLAPRIFDRPSAYRPALMGPT